MGSQDIKPLLLKSLLAEFEWEYPHYHPHDLWPDLDRFQIVAALVIVLGQGPYQGDQDVYNVLRSVLLKGNWGQSIDHYIGITIPILGFPVSDYHIRELAGFSLINLGDYEELEDILMAQFHTFNGKKAKDKFVQWVYSVNQSATVQALNSIAACDPQAYHAKELRSKPDFKKMISALESIGEEKCVKPLTTLYNNNCRDAVRVAVLVIQALGKIGGGEALETINKATENKSLQVRWRAKRILKMLKV